MDETERVTGAYSAEQREAAYQTYRDKARRSIRTTAELTSIPTGTLMTWSRVDGWQLRLRDDDDRAITVMRRHAQLTLLGKQDELIEKAYSLATGAENERTRLESIKFLLQVMGWVAPRDPRADGDDAANDQPPLALPDLTGLDADQLEAMLRQQMGG